MASPGNRRWQHRLSLTFHAVVALVASGVIATCLYLLGIFVFDPSGAEEWTVGLRPSQFHADIDITQKTFPDEVYASILGVAHNSGGSIEGVIEALISGADVIEVDVAEIDGVLYSAHSPPLPLIGNRWFRGPSLARIWAVSYGAGAIMLDLKESSQAFVHLVGDFLNDHSGQRRVIVSSRDVSVLRTVASLAPEVTTLLSIPDEQGVDNLKRDEAARSAIDGVTIRQTLLDAETVAWFRDNDLLVFAWTVNTLPRANELVGYGVDAITTDNLGILSLFSGSEPDLPASTPVSPPS